MDTRLLLDCYKLYADKLESLCRTHMSKAIVEQILYDAWITSANEVLASRKEEQDESTNGTK